MLIVSRPFSVQKDAKAKLAEDGKPTTTERRMALENGHPGVAIDEAAIRRGENPYTKYYHQQGEQPVASSQVRFDDDYAHMRYLSERRRSTTPEALERSRHP